MADVKWIKIVTDIFDDEKILLIESLPDKYAIIVCWFKLLCLAGKQNNNGVFLMNERIAYTEEMLAVIFRMPINTIRLSLQTFEDFGMIEIVDGVITIPNWEKHQDLDKLATAKEKTRLRVAKHREKQKQLAAQSPDVTDSNANCNATRNVTVTDSNANRIEEDKIRRRLEEEKKEKKEKESSRPTLQQISSFISENNLSVNADRFFNYYERTDWKTTKGNPVDWKDKLKEWSDKDKQNEQQNKPTVSSNPFLSLAKKNNLIKGDDLNENG